MHLGLVTIRARGASFALIAALLLSACGGAVTPSEPTSSLEATAATSVAPSVRPSASAAVPQPPLTVGPNGEAATASSEVQLTVEEQTTIRSGEYTAALLWAAGGTFTEAVSTGAHEAFESLGIEVIAETEAGFDAATQANDVATVLAQQPDIIISLTIDPVSGAAAFQPAVDAGVNLVFLSNAPAGYRQGEEYVGLVTDDLAGMGIAAAEMLGDALGGSGRVGYIFHDAPFYVTNQRDQAFRQWIVDRYPEIEIVAEEGMADPATAEQIAAAMLTRDPELDGIYAPWAGPADGVVAALRAQGRDDVKVVTMDLDTAIALDLAQRGNVVGIAADEAVELGRTLATVGAFGLIDKPAPAFVIAPALKVTASDLIDGWKRSLGTPPPQEILDASGS